MDGDFAMQNRSQIPRKESFANAEAMIIIMKIAVITGASSGIGREFVLQLSKKEPFDEIWVIARSKKALEDLQEEVSAALRILPLDLTDKSSFDAYQAMLQTNQPELSVLVNCAGFGKFGKYDEIPLSDTYGMIDLNCKAMVAMTTVSLPYMKKGAKIVQIDSLSAFQPVPYLNVYAATKAFVLSYSRALNMELKPRGIAVMAVSPGWVKTKFFDRAVQTNARAITYFNILYEPKDVVKTAITDLYRGKKDVSIHGFPVRAQVRLVKLLPHRLVMKIWMKQQKLPK